MDTDVRLRRRNRTKRMKTKTRKGGAFLSVEFQLDLRKSIFDFRLEARQSTITDLPCIHLQHRALLPTEPCLIIF